MTEREHHTDAQPGEFVDVPENEPGDHRDPEDQTGTSSEDR
jgi:hypothetical protein